MNFWILYFISIADNVSGVMALVGFVSSISLFIAIGFYYGQQLELDEHDYKDKTHKYMVYRSIAKAVKYLSVTCILSVFLVITVPSTNKLMAITGIYYTTNNEQIKELGESSLKLLQQELDEAVKENEESD